MSKKTTKAEKMFQVSACILVLEIRKGHLAWKVTEVVKKAGISRSLIYQYFGNNKAKMLKVAMHIFVEHFYGFDDNTTSFSKMIGRARRYTIEYPDVALFYQKTRMENKELSSFFKEVEARFCKRLKSIFPNHSKHQIFMLHVCVHGMVTAPFLLPEESIQVCELFLETAWGIKS